MWNTNKAIGKKEAVKENKKKNREDKKESENHESYQPTGTASKIIINKQKHFPHTFLAFHFTEFNNNKKKVILEKKKDLCALPLNT